MAFFQDPPRLGNQLDDDPMLPSWVARQLGGDARQVLAELRTLGDIAVDTYARQLADRLNEPVLTQWDAWGQRIDRIDVSPLWVEAQVLAAKHGMVAAGYEPGLGARARTRQFAIVHVLAPSLDVYSCPLAMTDGAARTLLASGNQPLIDRYVSKLTSRDPAAMWTSGQWMTERTGGSDVSQTETIAKQDADGQWRLSGTKWFTSATTSQMALTLARPEGNPEGSRGLALFLVELRDERGRLRNIEVNRLKDKLGTRKVPTAELTLAGAPAALVGQASEGVRQITPMLSVTRTWNAICATSGMRRAIALAKDFARRRKAFGSLLIDKPLHADTLALLEAEYAAAFCLAFRSVQLLGLLEHDSDPDLERLSRALIPLAKLTTGKQAVALASEAIESCGGAGYVEDTGLPRLLADAQVLPIWEGTTNVLSLDTLRALAKGGTLEALGNEIERCLVAATPFASAGGELAKPVTTARSAFRHASDWVASAMAEPDRLEAGARRFALTLGRSLELALLTDHAQWCLANGHGPRTAAAARRFAQTAIDQIDDAALADTKLLA